MSWNLNYILEAPLSASINRSDDIEKLTARLICE